MIIKDRIYGKFKIDSPVILELLQSSPVQRLKKISQMGPPSKYYHLKGCSRYEHSIGVMLILKHLGAPEEEQIAGLLHDISHTAFSHLIDVLVGSSTTEEYQDNHHLKYFLKSEIKQILIKYGYNPKKIAVNKNFPLLEKEIPDVCADRFDYAAREFNSDVARKCFRGLTVYQQQIVFKNEKIAYLFMINFLKRQQIHWGGYEAVTRYLLFAIALKQALKTRLIRFKDFWKDEDYIIKKLESSKNIKIKNILSVLTKKNLSFLPRSKKISHKKFRFVNPLFIENNKLIRLSKINKKFAKIIDQARKDNSRGINAGEILNF